MEVTRKSEAYGVENQYLWFQSSLSKTSHMPSENSTMLSLTFEMGLCKELPVWYKHINRKWKEVWASGEKHSRLSCCIQAAVARSVQGTWTSVEELTPWPLCKPALFHKGLGSEHRKISAVCSWLCIQSPHPVPLCSICVRKAGRGSWVRWGTERRLQEERGAVSFYTINYIYFKGFLI